MRILCAPNAFKGSLTAHEAAAAMARGVRRAGAEAVELPVADGGDGTAAVLGGRVKRTRVCGPYGERLTATWRMRADRTAIVEVAQVGLARTRKRDPIRASSVGLGEMIVAACRAGAKRVIVALGGSATVDGGVGVARVLVGQLALLKGVRLEACCDVKTRFLDAPRLFGPQKGASAKDVKRLTAHFAKLARLEDARFARLPGSGAAGGIGWALAAMFGARLRAGAEMVLEEVKFRRALRGVDLVLTGEGRWDRTTAEGKAPWVVMREARKAGVRAAALCGSVSGRVKGVRAFARTEREGIRRADRLLEQAAFEETAAALEEGTGGG